MGILIKIAIYFLIAVCVTSIFYHLKRRRLFGGYIGGLVIAIIGVIIGEYVLDHFFMDKTKEVLNFLVQSTGVNIITGFLGAYGAVYLMNRLNHDKERAKKD
jgi:uncharacterized membrane protein YeaQ/YmgE (transglycosylase-associated protein family)